MMIAKKWWAAALLALVVHGGTPMGRAMAEAEWLPFGSDEKPLTRNRDAGRPVANNLPPPLPPMGGVIPQVSDGRGNTAPAPGAVPSGYGAAYPGSEVQPPPFAPLPGGNFPTAGGASAGSGKVERIDLDPTPATATAIGTATVPAAGGNALPVDAWRGLDVKGVEESFAGMTLPPRSAALQGLWTRLLEAAADAPVGGRGPAHFDALRMEALYRSGLIAALGERLDHVAADDPIFQAFAVRRDLALGRREAACAMTKALVGKRNGLPTALVSELNLLSGYCAAAEGNAAGAGLAAELARDERVDAPVALAALDAIAGGAKAALVTPKVLRVLDYRLLELLGPVDPVQVIDKAEPALVTALALADTTEPQTRAVAAEAAARLNAITPDQLLNAYRAAPAGADDPVLRRAELVRLITSEQAAPRKLQLCKALIEDARRAGLLVPIAKVVAATLSQMQPEPGLAVQAETAVEIFLAAGDTAKARLFATLANARHWLPLIDIAEQAPSEMQREQNLQAIAGLAQRGQLPAELLHRLATVLDATDVNVPIPLWEAASRTPQPAGYLPETGVLAHLQQASQKKDVARTILAVMRALGPAPADRVHIIALGDSIRALRRVGLDADARRLGVEALLAQWPRGAAT